MDPKIYEIVNIVSLLSFVVLVILALVRIIVRYVEYRRLGIKVPALLPRDFFLFAGLAVPFAGVLLFRALSIVAREHWWAPIWFIGSNAFALFGVAYWVYYEYFKVEK